MDLAVPTWVTQPDGRLVPFDPDQIAQALFAASQSLGRPDAFAARELTDGVVHFLSRDGDNAPTTAQIAETVIKVVRELGQPELAHAFASHRKPIETAVADVNDATRMIATETDPVRLAWILSKTALRAFSRRDVFSPDLIAAHDEGFITLAGLDTPHELGGGVLAISPGQSIADAVATSRSLVGEHLAIDAPEHLGVKDIPATVQQFADRLTALALRGVVHLNSRARPVWADDLARGPLFRSVSSAEPVSNELRPESWLDGCLHNNLGVHWHLDERDVKLPDPLRRLARLAVDGAEICFTFDRPRRPVALSEGLDRQHPAVLLTVGLHLPRLAAQPGVSIDFDLFLKKLGSLARLAISAAVQKRAFLRKQSRPWPAFLVDRARLVVAPVGLETLTLAMTDKHLCDPAGLALGQRVVQTLASVVQQDGRSRQIDAVIDGPDSCRVTDDGTALTSATIVAGLTSWDRHALPRDQLRAAGALHALSGSGLAVVFIDPDDAATIPELLRFAWQQTDVVRVRFVSSRAQETQRVAPWA
jgi:hypothetical protein